MKMSEEEKKKSEKAVLKAIFRFITLFALSFALVVTVIVCPGSLLAKIAAGSIGGAVFGFGMFFVLDAITIICHMTARSE